MQISVRNWIGRVTELAAFEPAQFSSKIFRAVYCTVYLMRVLYLFICKFNLLVFRSPDARLRVCV